MISHEKLLSSGNNLIIFPVGIMHVATNTVKMPKTKAPRLLSIAVGPSTISIGVLESIVYENQIAPLNTISDMTAYFIRYFQSVLRSSLQKDVTENAERFR